MSISLFGGYANDMAYMEGKRIAAEMYSSLLDKDKDSYSFCRNLHSEFSDTPKLWASKYTLESDWIEGCQSKLRTIR